MGSLERRAREKAGIRSRILNAARDLFIQEGYQAVTMRRIAEKVEYTATALYFHFRNKEALLQELSDQDALALGSHLARLRTVPDPLDRVRQVGMAYVEFAMAHPDQFRLLFLALTPSLPPERSTIKKGDPNQDAYALLLEPVREAIEQGRLHPALTDAELVAQALWAGVHGVAALHLTKRSDAWVDWRPAHDTARLMVETLLAGILRRPTV